jgi:hypothetical protein
VRIITSTPSRRERPNAAQMSTTPRPSQRLPNQWVDTPRMGNVSPPVGPWNDSTRMVTIGPYRNTTNRPKNAARPKNAGERRPLTA